MSNVQEMPVVEEVKSSLQQGATALQTRSTYQTAVTVGRERNLEKVLAKCLEEAAIAGDDFFYSWEQGGQPIEGLTIGASQALARNFGNCALEVKVEETPSAYIFYGAFIDLETGFNLVRPFRQNRTSPKTKSGKDVYSGDRAQDVLFQIGASKAMRNAALNAMPKWLTTKVIEKAKENVVAKIQKMGIEKAKAMIINKAGALKIGQDRIEAIYGKERVWDVEKVIKITSALRAVEDGLEKPTDLFPIATEDHSEPVVAEAKVVEKQPAQKQESKPAEEAKSLSRQEILELLEAVDDKTKLAKFKGKILVDLESLGALEREEVIQAIHTKEMLFDRPKKEVVAPASESALVIEYKGKIAGSHLKTTLNKYRKEINEHTVLGEDEKTYLVGLVTEQMGRAK